MKRKSRRYVPVTVPGRDGDEAFYFVFDRQTKRTVECTDHDAAAEVAKLANESAEAASQVVVTSLIEALEAGDCPCWPHNARVTKDIEALRKAALWYRHWNNNVRIPAIQRYNLSKEKNDERTF